MPEGITFAKPYPGMLRAAVRLMLVVLIPGVFAFALGGKDASLVVGLCTGSAMTFGVIVKPRPAALVVLAVGVCAGLGAATAGYPWLSGLAVAFSVLITAPANAYSAGMLLMAPILTILVTKSDDPMLWWEASAWAVFGGVAGLVIVKVMKWGLNDPKPIDKRLAWRHAVVLAIAVATAMIAAEMLGLPHGYWIAVTLTVVLRPVPDERKKYIRMRLYGTVLGSLLALLTIIVLPNNLLILASFVYLVLLAAYAMSANYFMQTIFLTPMLMLFLTIGSPSEATFELTLERVAFTLIGLVASVVLVLIMERWDQRSGLISADSATV